MRRPAARCDGRTPRGGDAGRDADAVVGRPHTASRGTATAARTRATRSTWPTAYCGSAAAPARSRARRPACGESPSASPQIAPAPARPGRRRRAAGSCSLAVPAERRAQQGQAAAPRARPLLRGDGRRALIAQPLHRRRPAGRCPAGRSSAAAKAKVTMRHAGAVDRGQLGAAAGASVAQQPRGLRRGRRRRPPRRRRQLGTGSGPVASRQPSRDPRQRRRADAGPDVRTVTAPRRRPAARGSRPRPPRQSGEHRTAAWPLPLVRRRIVARAVDQRAAGAQRARASAGIVARSESRSARPGVDAAEQRLDQPVDDLVAQPRRGRSAPTATSPFDGGCGGSDRFGRERASARPRRAMPLAASAAGRRARPSACPPGSGCSSPAGADARRRSSPGATVLARARARRAARRPRDGGPASTRRRRRRRRPPTVADVQLAADAAARPRAR